MKVMRRALFRGFGLALVIWGVALLLLPGIGVTGFTIVEDVGLAARSVLGMVLVVGGVVLFLLGSPLERIAREGEVIIKGRVYEPHAIERMKERNLMPSAVKNALDNGEHYSLRHVTDDDVTRGATDVYIYRHGADIAPGGKIGGRILHVRNDGEKREYQSIVVLTDKRGVVKTVFVDDDTKLKKFVSKYVDERRREAA